MRRGQDIQKAQPGEEAKFTLQKKLLSFSVSAVGHCWLRLLSSQRLSLGYFPSGVGVGMPAVPSSPRHLHPTPQMTAWARWNWTSGHTSPSSPTRPASESEQPSATTGHKHGRHPLPGWLFKENFLLPFGLCSLPCSPHFHTQFLLQFLPNLGGPGSPFFQSPSVSR